MWKVLYIFSSKTPQKIPTAPSSDEKLEALKKIAEETKEQLEKSGVDVPINPPTDPSTTADEDPKSPITPGSLVPDPSKPVIRPPQVPKLPLPVPSVPQDEPAPQSPQPPPVDTSGYESNTLKNGETVIKNNWAFTKWTYRNKADDKMLFNHANDPDETIPMLYLF